MGTPAEIIIKEQVEGELSSILDREIMEWILRVTHLMGYPKSVGEIYGLLYVSRDPLSMSQIRETLNMSLGAASQGLKLLRTVKAVKTVYVPGSRSDFYEAETHFRRLVGNFLQEEVQPVLENSKDRLEVLQKDLKSLSPELQEHYGNRLRQMKNLNAAANRLIPLLNRFLTVGK